MNGKRTQEHDFPGIKQKKLVLFLSGMLLASACLAGSAEFKEDFESAEAGKPIKGQNSWGESIYGQHPAAVVSFGEDIENKTKFIKGPGGADHYNSRAIEPEICAGIFSSKVILVRVSVKGSTSLWLGDAKDQQRLVFDIGERLRVNVNHDKVLNGVASPLKKGAWFEIAFALEKLDNGSHKIYAGIKPFNDGKMEFDADPLISSVDIAASDIAPTSWNSLCLRLDGNDAVDDISIGGYSDMNELPVKFNTSKKLETAYNPLLDHLLPPRQAFDLNGIWEAAPAPATEPEPPASGWQTVVVPDEHRGLFTGKNDSVWFRKSFRIDRKDPEMRYFLCFERVTDTCEIFVNKQSAGSSDDGYFPFRIDVTGLILEGSNGLLVKVLSPAANKVPGRRPQGFGYNYGLLSGIPFPVHLESAGALTIEDIFVITRLSPSPMLEAQVTVRNNSSKAMDASLLATVGKEFRQELAPASLAPGESRILTLKGNWTKPHLWWPHDPYLQYIDVEIRREGKTVDAKRQRFGFREISVKGPDMFLNGVKFMHRRSSMISYWSNVGEEVQRNNIALLRERGFNGYRIHGGPSLRVARTADELGWLVAPEAAICSPKGGAVLPEFWPAAGKHLSGMIRTMRNSPSVIYWCLSNEFASYFTKGTPEEKAQVDEKMIGFGKMAVELDPAHIWTCSGDGELGGMGKHGPAPSLSFHYPWQPFKIGNMIPNTAYWLDEGLAPWYGIVWDRTKPLFISEDLYPPYALHIPDGMTQWAGDSAYDPEKGVYKAWFDSVRMLANGYYHAGVSCWNIWGTYETMPNNPLYDLGQPVPDFLIALRESSGNLFCNSSTTRKIILYNQTFVNVDCVLTSRLTGKDKEYRKVENTLSLPAGERKEVSIQLDIPDFMSRSNLQWSLTLTDKPGHILAQEKYEVTAFQKTAVTPPANCVLVAGDAQILKDTAFPAGRFTDLQSALEKRPAA
ncbi:MAG: sugar-binding domain-containing protein, partial [Victivallales bacterium]